MISLPNPTKILSMDEPSVALTPHQWKIVFNAVRRRQRECISQGPIHDEEYHELNMILDRISPIAYSETYLND
tara:strand:+ start:199 stop:417 length:219 start_codon:yes stop_codon:yes gene_type:complete